MNNSRIPEAGAREWLQAMHAQFQNIASQGETEVIATYQTANITERTQFEFEVGTRARCVMQAAKARMHAIIGQAPSKEERRRLRKVFLEVTGCGSFQRLWPWGG